MMRPELPVRGDIADYKRHFHDDVWQQAAAIICARHGIPHRRLRRSSQGENVIFFVDESFVIKIFAPFREGFSREKAALEFAQGKCGIATPAVEQAGEIEGWSYLVMTRLGGVLMRDVWSSIDARERAGIVSSLGVALNELHAHDASLPEATPNHDWREFIERQARACVERQRACGANPEWLASLPAYIESRLGLLPSEFRPALLHGDAHPGNVLLAETGGRWRLTGLFDFADSLRGFHEYEFVSPGVLMLQGKRELQRAFLLAYGYREAQLDLSLRARLMLLTVLYECSDLRKYALRLAPEAVHLTLDELEASIWRFAAE